MSEAVYAVSNVDNLYLMIAGPVVPNPTELLSTDRFEKMLIAFRKVYDYIIIDGPPLGMVVDSAIIARHCDGAAIVIESGTIKYRFCPGCKGETSKRRLSGAGCDPQQGGPEEERAVLRQVLWKILWEVLWEGIGCDRNAGRRGACDVAGFSCEPHFPIGICKGCAL